MTPCLVTILAVYGAVAVFRDVAYLQERGGILRAKHRRYIEDLRTKGTYDLIEEWLTDYPLFSSKLYYVEFTRNGKNAAAFFSERSEAERYAKEPDEKGKKRVLRIVSDIIK